MLFQIPIHDPVLIFALVMLIVLIAPLVAQKMKLPGIIGLIAAGVLFGPHLFGILERDKTIELLGTVGLLYVMFQAGLEIDLIQVKKTKKYSVMFGLSTFIFPQIFGILAGYFILKLDLITSILLACMFSSHTLLTFPIASKMGLTKKRAVSTTIGGTIITDTLSLTVLAIIIKANSGDLNWYFWLKFGLLTSLYTIALFYFLPKLSSWFFRHFSTEVGIEDYVFVIASLFASAHFAHLAGLEPIIGALLIGLVLNQMIPESSVLMNRIQFVGNALFIPFFLVSVGMLINPKLLLSDVETITISIVMVVGTVLAKWLGVFVFCKSSGFSKTEIGLMYGLSINHAAATLAVAMVGFKAGIFHESILTGAILVIAATCFIGPIFTEIYSRRMLAETEDKYDYIVQKSMDRILIPIKNPATLNPLIDFAILLHPKNSHEPLYPLSIAIEGNNVDEQVIAGENLLTKAITRINSVNKGVVPLTKLDINVPSAIIKSVQAHRISKVIFGWNDNNNFKHHLFNNIIELYLKESHEMVFVCRLLHPLNIISRLILIIPPLMTKQNGFNDTIRSLKLLSQAINAKIVVFAEKESINDLEEMFIRQNPQIKVDFREITSWKFIVEAMKKCVKSTDMLIQLIARPGRPAWRLSFDRMPSNLKNNFSNNNMLVVYPYYHTDDYENDKEFFCNELALLKRVPAKNFYFKQEKGDIGNLFDNILAGGEFNYHEEIKNQLIQVAENSPIELTNEIVLIHIHTEQVSDYQIYIAVSQPGFEVKGLETTPHAIVTLLSPTDQPPQQHLKRLAEIARMVQVKQFTNSIFNAESYESFITMLGKIDSSCDIS